MNKVGSDLITMRRVMLTSSTSDATRQYSSELDTALAAPSLDIVLAAPSFLLFPYYKGREEG